jgi:hypothetical protein
MNAVEARKNSRRNGCRRNKRRTMRGGTGSFAYTIGSKPIAPEAPYAAEIVRMPACEPATRPGYITPEPKAHGLPGFSGGYRRRHKKYKGGRYTTTFETVGPAQIALANHQSIACDTPRANPLNNTDYSKIVTYPSPLAPLPQPGAPFGTQKGGSGCGVPLMRGGVGGVDSMVYEAPRAGYTHVPSDAAGGSSGTLADGKTPFLLNVPYDTTPKVSSACTKTGGSRKGRKTRKAKKSKKSRKYRGRK